MKTHLALSAYLVLALSWLPESTFSQVIPPHILNAIIKEFGAGNVHVQRENSSVRMAGSERDFLYPEVSGGMPNPVLDPPVGPSWGETVLNSVSPDSVRGASSLAGNTSGPSSSGSIRGNPQVAVGPLVWVIRIGAPIGLWKSIEWFSDLLEGLEFCGRIQGSRFGVVFNCEPEFKIVVEFY